jgi:predicted esterase
MSMTTPSPSRLGRRVVVALVATALALSGCAGDDSDTTADTSDVEPGTDDAATADDGRTQPETDTDAAVALAASLDDCPGDYASGELLAVGENDDFASGGQDRSFHLMVPDEDHDGPRPLFLALTGTVQSEVGFLEQSGIDALVDDGWIVVAPVRNNNGMIWGPWDAMRTDAQRPLPNPDIELFDDAIACVAAHHDVDASRIFVGGISIGGTMVTHLLRVRSDLYAGGIVGSGNFATTEPAEPEPLDDMVVIVAWGGDEDEWSGCMDGRMGREAGESGEPGCIPSISFVNDAALASQFFDAEPAVAQVACSMDVGHRWITEATDYFAQILYDHPKGTAGPAALPDGAPDGLTCSTEAFVPEND